MHRFARPTPQGRRPLPVGPAWVPALVIGLALGCGPAGDAPPATDGEVEADIPAGPDILLADLQGSGVELSLEGMRWVTTRPGYDNQPSFTPDGTALLYTEGTPDSRTNLIRYDLASGTGSPVEATPNQSEYSGIVPPSGEGVAAIRVEPDSTQRLWYIGTADSRPVFEDLAPVGYHAWIDENHVAMFVLGNPNTLRLGDPATQEVTVITERIGRSLQPFPGRRAISFISVPDTTALIQLLDVDTETTSVLMPALEGSEDFAWTPDGVALMGRESTLYARHPDTHEGWIPIADLSEYGTNISRIAVHPAGDGVAIVIEPHGD